MVDNDDTNEFSKFRAQRLVEGTMRQKKYESGPVFFGQTRQGLAAGGNGDEADEAKRTRLRVFEAKMKARDSAAREGRQRTEGNRQLRSQERLLASEEKEQAAEEERAGAARMADDQAKLDASDEFAQFRKERLRPTTKRTVPEGEPVFVNQAKGALANSEDDVDQAKRERMRAFEAEMELKAKREREAKSDAELLRKRRLVERLLKRDDRAAHPEHSSPRLRKSQSSRRIARLEGQRARHEKKP